MTYRNLSGKQINKRALAMLEKVGMAKFHHHKPSELSGGQQQRVAIARALVGKPDIILANELTGALDSKTSQEVLDLLIQLNREEGCTVVLITHDEQITAQCPRVIKMHDALIVP